MNSQVSKRLLAMVASFETTRDELFECSRQCVSEGADNGWQVAEELFALAKNADAIRQHISSLVSAKPGSNVQQPISEARRAKAVATKAERKRKDDYPKFAVRGTSLVKTGLSRDRRTEYEHLVPKSEYDKVLAQLIAMSDRVKEFTTDEVQVALECPLYQTYTVLSMLKHFKLLDLPRRGLYTFSSRKTFRFEVAEVWSKLETAQV